MTWAWHKLQCCCEEVGGCEQYVPCCINGLEATWAIRSEQFGGTGYVNDGIVLDVHLENLCNTSVGGDWSSFITDSGSNFKEYATTIPPAVSSLQTEFGCLAGLTVDPDHLVCPCDSLSSQYNFKLSVLVRNCETTNSTYYVDVSASSLCFSIGNGRAVGYDCCMVLGGYSIDGGPIITAWESDFWIPIVVNEDFPVEVCFYFRYNPECQDCIDTNQTTPLTVADERFSDPGDPFYTFRFTPQKECYELACNRAASGLPTFPLFTAEAYDSCLDCKAVADAVPSISTPTFDSRLIICDNCWWAVAFNTNPSDPILGYGTDANCVCGCPTLNRKVQTTGPNQCIKPTAVRDAASSNSGSATVCGKDAINSVIWRGARFDGCTGSNHKFDTSSYVGPWGSVSTSGADGVSTPGGLVITDPLFQFTPCEIVSIAWDNVEDGASGGFPCYLVSITIKGETWTARRCPGEARTVHDILWLVDNTTP